MSRGGQGIDVVAFGEVLWDVIDGVSHIGGAPFNFGSLSQRSPVSAKTLEELLKAYSGTLVFFDVNLRQDCRKGGGAFRRDSRRHVRC